jgi:hypothetical protein
MAFNAWGADPGTIHAEEPLEREPPRLLMRESSPADPFPIEALGTVLAPAARGINDRVRAPMAICGQSVLAAAALAVQGHANVVLSNGQLKPLSIYCITVAATGERKSSCDDEATWPIRRREECLRERYESDLASYNNEKLAFEKSRDAAVKLGRGAKPDRAAMKAALDALGPAPTAPLVPLLTCSEPTFEGLCKLFASGFPSLGIFSAEGGQFIGSHGMSDEAKLRTAAGLSDVWDGVPIKRVRSGDGTLVLPGRRLSLHLMAQPRVADALFRDPLLADQGLLSRLLVTAPDTAAGTRLWRQPQPESEAAIRRYGARLLSILETPLPLSEGKLNELDPRPLRLAPKAVHQWISFADHVEQRLPAGGTLEPVRGLGNKLAEHAARLAGVLRLTADLGAEEITSDDMEAGIALADHYAAEALRLFGVARVRAELHLAQRLLDWLLQDWLEPVISLIEIYQQGPNPIREKATAQKLVDILVEHGWLEKIPEGAVVAGQRRRDAWRIVRG